MGQTLSHGVYLPNEGERNCYAGLASNWQILNTAVGNIAEKAPLVHTHGNISNDGKVGTTANVPLITGTGGVVQAGSFGTSANTFCEGNDSRLSDARTPVAHTHTKSDVTDLFNSGNTWIFQNTYTVTGDVPIKITNNKDATNPSATEIKHIRFVDVNGKIIGGLGNSLESGGTSKMHLYSRSFSSDGSSNSTHGLLIVNNKQTGVHEVQSESNFIPSANNSYDLGSSSYQWNNLYATTTNTDTIQSVSGNLLMHSTGTDKVVAIYNGTRATDGGGIWLYGKDSDSGALVKLQIYNTTTSKYEGIVLDSVNFYPDKNNLINLGTSDYKWKTLNGINPGALSLPSNTYTGTTAITEIDRTGWVYDGTANSYTPPVDCWLSISNGGSITVWGTNTAFGMKATDNIAIPLRQGETYDVSLTHSPDFCRIYPCQGNV